MGQSTDAILFYGYCWEDEFEYDDDEFPKEGPSKWDEALRTYGSNEPVQATFHCSDSCSVPYIYVEDSRITAWRGGPKKVRSDHLSINPMWNELLTQFCDRFGITPPEGQQPQWWLVSWWG